MKNNVTVITKARLEKVIMENWPSMSLEETRQFLKAASIKWDNTSFKNREAGERNLNAWLDHFGYEDETRDNALYYWSGSKVMMIKVDTLNFTELSLTTRQDFIDVCVSELGMNYNGTEENLDYLVDLLHTIDNPESREARIVLDKIAEIRHKFGYKAEAKEYLITNRETGFKCSFEDKEIACIEFLRVDPELYSLTCPEGKEIKQKTWTVSGMIMNLEGRLRDDKVDRDIATDALMLLNTNFDLDERISLFKLNDMTANMSIKNSTLALLREMFRLQEAETGFEVETKDKEETIEMDYREMMIDEYLEFIEHEYGCEDEERPEVGTEIGLASIERWLQDDISEDEWEEEYTEYGDYESTQRWYVEKSLIINETNVTEVDKIDGKVVSKCNYTFKEAYETFRALNNGSLDWIELGLLDTWDCLEHVGMDPFTPDTEFEEELKQLINDDLFDGQKSLDEIELPQEDGVYTLYTTKGNDGSELVQKYDFKNEVLLFLKDDVVKLEENCSHFEILEYPTFGRFAEIDTPLVDETRDEIGLKLIEIWQERDSKGEIMETRRVIFFDRNKMGHEAYTYWNHGNYEFIRHQKFENPISYDSEVAFLNSLPKTSLFKRYATDEHLIEAKVK